MSLEFALQKYPKQIELKDGSKCKLRPLRKEDEKYFHQFFLAVPEAERMFIKHRVTEPEVIRDWCQNIDLGRNLPLLAVVDGKIVGDATLHQQLGGWKRHIGRVSVLVHPKHRGRGLARALVTEIVNIARSLGLEKVEAEFIGEQEAAIKLFALLGFSNLVRLENYVKDMQAIAHDYVLMGLQLKTDEEYAGAWADGRCRRRFVPTAGRNCRERRGLAPSAGRIEQTGWSEAARTDGLDLPDENFDYDDFVKREFGDPSPVPRGIPWFWWVVAAGLAAVLVVLWLR